MKLVLIILGLKSALCATELSEVGSPVTEVFICSDPVNTKIKGIILHLVASAFLTTFQNLVWCLVPIKHIFAFHHCIFMMFLCEHISIISSYIMTTQRF